jgi:hypothetical protein
MKSRRMNCVGHVLRSWRNENWMQVTRYTRFRHTLLFEGHEEQEAVAHA